MNFSNQQGHGVHSQGLLVQFFFYFFIFKFCFSVLKTKLISMGKEALVD